MRLVAFLLLLLLFSPFTSSSTPSSSSSSSSSSNGFTALSLASRNVIVDFIHNASTGTIDIHVPPQVRPFMRPRGDLLSEWAAWSQRLFESLLVSSGHDGDALKSSLLYRPTPSLGGSASTAAPAVPAVVNGRVHRVRFVRAPDHTYAMIQEEATTRNTLRDTMGTTLPPSAWTWTYSPVFEVKDGDYLSVWKTLADRKYDERETFFHLRVLSWNLFLVTKMLGRKQDVRAPLFGRYSLRMGDFDAICLSECFSPEACDRALDSFREVGYANVTTRINQKRVGGLIQSAGVFIATKHEIVSQHHLVYSDHWTTRRLRSPLNYLVQRGAVVARMRTADGDYFSMACTHPDYSKHREKDNQDKIDLNSLIGQDLDLVSQHKRQRQLRQLRMYIDRTIKLPDQEPLVLAGDFNVDKRHYANIFDAIRMDGMDATKNGNKRSTLPLSDEEVNRLLKESPMYDHLSVAQRAWINQVRSTYSGTPHLRDTIAALEVRSAGAYGGCRMTLEPASNDLVHTKKSKYLDYIFVDADHRVEAEPFVQWCFPIKLDEKDAYDKPGIGATVKRWLGKGTKYRDLSDHYPVGALLRFRRDNIVPAVHYEPDETRKFVEPATLPYTEVATTWAHHQFRRAYLAADPLMLYTRAATRAQNAMIIGNLDPVPQVHADFRPGGVWRHFFTFNASTGLFHWRPRDYRQIFSDLTRIPVAPDYLEMDLRVMQYNVYMPGGIERFIAPSVAAFERATRIPKYIHRLGGDAPFDAVCFAECFRDALCTSGYIGKTMRDKYGYHISGKATKDGAVVKDAGVFIATPHKILKERRITFKNTASGVKDCLQSPANCFTRRGAVHVEAQHRVTGRKFHIVCGAFEHAAVDMNIFNANRTYDREAGKRRLEQLGELHTFLYDAFMSGDPIVLLADTNTQHATTRTDSGAITTVDEQAEQFIAKANGYWATSYSERVGGESFSGEPFENRLLDRLYPGRKPSSAGIILPAWRDHTWRKYISKTHHSKLRPVSISSVLWTPHLVTDDDDGYAPQDLKSWTKHQFKSAFNAIKRLGRKVKNFARKLKFWSEDTEPIPLSEDELYKHEKWHDLSVNYPLLGRFIFYDAEKAATIKRHIGDKEYMAQFDPTVVAAGSIVSHDHSKKTPPGYWVAPSDEQWAKYVKLVREKKEGATSGEEEASEEEASEEVSTADEALAEAERVVEQVDKPKKKSPQVRLGQSTE